MSEPGRISLGNAVFEGENNVYLLGTEPGEETTLIDAGMGTPETHQRLLAGLSSHGVDVEDVDTVLLTHFHADHAGLAGEIQAASGATVLAHEADKPLIEQDPEAWEAFDTLRREYLEQWGMPADKQSELQKYFHSFPDRHEPAPTVEAFGDGDEITVGGREVRGMALPGHTAGLLGFVIDGPDRKELFSGDALLPYYTPNVGGADVRVERALASYLDSLSRIVNGDFDVAWPGHRNRIDAPADRAREILSHHHERTVRVVDVLRTHGPATPWAVSDELFGHLEEIHILHGPGEAYAHLEHLREYGVVERTDGEYDLLDEDPEYESLFPDVVFEE